ncbi:MAG: hypothetical protein D6748_01745 [Calditrichaeota bacterium]|nr:MAG: hypothetical protein D6748_01745 [Calditrichota bacterium]
MYKNGFQASIPGIGHIFFVLILILPIYAQNTPGVQFLRMSVGSRAQAMGEAYTAIAQNSNGIYYNPAGMGFGLNRELLLFHSEWFEDIAMENMTFFYPFTTRWSVATGISYLHMPELTRYEVDPTTGGPLENGKFSVYNMVITTGIGFRVTDNLAIGTNFKFFQDQLESVKASGVAFDLGILARLPGYQWSVGMAIQHLGPAVKYLDALEKLPLTYRAGVAYRFTNFQGVVALDLVKVKGQSWNVLPGIELGFTDNFFVRGGYQVSDREGSGITAGFGVKLNRHKLNYVYVPFGDLGDTHRAELIFHFGEPPLSTAHLQHRTAQQRQITRKAREELRQQPSGVTPQSKKPTTPKTAPQELKEKVPGTVPAKMLPPSGVKIVKVNEQKLKLTWDPIPDSGVGYHIYAKPINSLKWIRITKEPLKVNYQFFSPKKKGVIIQFVITAVMQDKESDFSQIVTYEAE